ncbi:hypothetical protein [Nocardia tengchongensis]|uniref:hypothetical protein n=1 Tax=Nocardia tengchongensis TaxID=2055889 RepID=UPI00368CD987
MTNPETVDEKTVAQLRKENARLHAQRDVAEAKIAILDTVGKNFQATNAELLKQVAGLKSRISKLTKQRNELRVELFNRASAETRATK